MAQTTVPMPITFQVRPATKGLNVSKPPQSIDKSESGGLMNVRFNDGQILFRDGFKIKYVGMFEPTIWIDTLYIEGFTKLIAFTQYDAYYESSGAMNKIPVYDGAGGTLSSPVFTMDPATQNIAIDIGNGAYDFVSANNGNYFYDSDKQAEILVMANGTSDGIFVFAYTEQTDPIEGEKIAAAGAPSSGKSVATFAGRLFVCGTSDNASEVRWSAVGRFDHWDTETYTDAGSTILGDSPDWIQRATKLGEYLIIYKERSIYIGRETYLADPPVRFESAPGQGIGLAAPNSIGDLGEEQIFLGWDDVYVFSLQRIVPIGTRIKNDLFYGSDGILPKYLNACIGAIAEEFNEYWLFVPSGKWPGAGSDYDDPVTNLLDNPNFENDATGWTLQDETETPPTPTFTTGVLGTQALELAVGDAAGDTGEIHVSTEYDAGETIQGREYSVVFLGTPSTDMSITITLTERTGAGASLSEGVVVTNAITVADGYQRIVASYVVQNATCQILEIEIEHQVVTTGQDFQKFDLDAVHLVRVDNISDEYLDESSGYKDVAIIGPDNELQPIPFIIDYVGQWMADTCWVYNYEENAWSKWRLPITGFGYDSLQQVITLGDLVGSIADQTWRFGEKRLTEFAPTNLLGQPDGQIYEVSKEHINDFIGVASRPYVGYWESKDFDLDSPVTDKTFSRFIIYHETSHTPVEITVGISTDSGRALWQDRVVQVVQGTTQTFVDFFVTGPQARFRLKATSPGFFVSGFAVKLVPRGESQPY